MGYTTSTVHGIEVPDSSEANDVPEDIGKVVTALEGGSIVRRLTSAQIAALTAPQKPAGLVVYNTTTGVLQVSTGADFVPTWTSPALGSSWVAYGGAWTTAGYTKDMLGVVRMRGLIKGGTVGALFTLPSGFRPQSSHMFIVPCTDSDTVAKAAEITVAPDGVVYLNKAAASLGASTYVGLAPISFPTAY